MDTTTQNQLTGLLKVALKQAGYAESLLCGFEGDRILLDSTGLDLAIKAAIERTLVTALDRARSNGILGADLHPVVYFRRNASHPPKSMAGGPVPATKSGHSAPWGLKFAKRNIPNVKKIILVASGKGGVGKSTVSANLAVALAAKHQVGLLDADVYGPSAQILLGLRGAMPVTSGNMLRPLEGHGVKVVSFGFLADTKQPIIWRGPMVSKALEQFFFDVDWGELDYLIVDMPPGTGDVQMTIAERLPITGAIIVTTPQDVALVDAHKAISMFEKLNVPVLGAVENMAWFTCSNCGQQEHIFGHDGFEVFLQERQLKLLARIPLSRQLRTQSDEGRPVAREGGENPLAKPWHDLAHAVVCSDPPQRAPTGSDSVTNNQQQVFAPSTDNMK